MNYDQIDKSKPFIAVDFDGVISDEEWDGVDEISFKGKPVQGVGKWLADLAERYNVFVISSRFSARQGPDGKFKCTARVTLLAQFWFEARIPEIQPERMFWASVLPPFPCKIISKRSIVFENSFPAI